MIVELSLDDTRDSSGNIINLAYTNAYCIVLPFTAYTKTCNLTIRIMFEGSYLGSLTMITFLLIPSITLESSHFTYTV